MCRCYTADSWGLSITRGFNFGLLPSFGLAPTMSCRYALSLSTLTAPDEDPFQLVLASANSLRAVLRLRREEDAEATAAFQAQVDKAMDEMNQAVSLQDLPSATVFRTRLSEEMASVFGSPMVALPET